MMLRCICVVVVRNSARHVYDMLQFMKPYTHVPSLQAPLANQIENVIRVLTQYQAPGYLGSLLIGSCSLGQATYRSDIDLVMVFENRKLDFGFAKNIRDEIESQFSQDLNQPLPIHITVVGPSIFTTQEPEMRQALAKGLILDDRKNQLSLNLKSRSPE